MSGILEGNFLSPARGRRTVFYCNTTFSRVLTFVRPVFGTLPDDVINDQNRGQSFFVWVS
jgi:hypothetical protein